MSEPKSEGKCIYCAEIFAKNGISRHLTSHIKRVEKIQSTKKTSFFIKVTGGDLYFLYLLVHEDSTLRDLDSYLREIWLECCGHLSSFEMKGARMMLDWFEGEDEYGIDMGTKVNKLFEKGQKFNYEYDFGSTTQLEISVLNEFTIRDKDKIFLLSRNEPLVFSCDTCGENPAEAICTICYPGENMFCATCGEAHSEECEDFAEYAEGIIVNSPRMGVCAYEGGTIDVERD